MKTTNLNWSKYRSVNPAPEGLDESGVRDYNNHLFEEWMSKYNPKVSPVWMNDVEAERVNTPFVQVVVCVSAVLALIVGIKYFGGF